MDRSLSFSPAAGLLWCAHDGVAPDRTSYGRVLDPWNWRWERSGSSPSADAEPVTTLDAVRRVHQSGRCRLLPVAVIGPREPTPAQSATAGELGAAIADLGVPLLCGGKGGVMEAAARGARTAGGLTLAFLPDDDWRQANDFIALPLATGIGKARNALIAQSAVALVAVGGQYGTITEAAYGLHFDKPVFGLEGPPEIPGLRRMDGVGPLIEALAPILLRLPEMS